MMEKRRLDLNWIIETKQGKLFKVFEDLVHPGDLPIGSKMVTQAGELITIKDQPYAEDAWGWEVISLYRP